MNNSTDDTSELDSYGVWVKHSSSINQQPDANDNLSELDTTDFDFPIEDQVKTQEDNIFEDSDFSDMFQSDDQFTTNNIETSDDDSTLTADELANIATGTEITEVQAEVSEEPDFSAFQSEEEIDLNAFDTNETEIDISSFEDQTVEVSDFTEDSSDYSEEVTFGEGDEEEISLDDFMTDGFSDESVSAGNLGFSPEDRPSPAPSSSGDTEEISLDDFFDAGDDLGFLDDTPAAPKEEDIPDAKPLEMDISFDSSVSTVETEDNITPEVEEMDDSSFSETSSFVTDEISIDSFDTGSSSSSDSMGEEIDLSDFGIDSNAEETAVTQDVQEAKTKDTVVDYDLFVGDDNNIASAPVVNEIKTDSTPNESASLVKVVENKIEKAEENSDGENENMDSITSSLLQQIVADLSSLKNEINSIKNDLAAIKTQEPVAVEVPVSEATPVTEEPQIEIPEDTSEGGFFGNDDTDDTIALSGDELNNIMNTAEFSTIEEETPVVEEDNEPIVEETSVEIPLEEESVIDSVDEVIIEETTLEETVTVETPEEEVTVDDVVVESPEEEINFDDLNVEDTVTETITEEEVPVEEEIIIEETPVEEEFNIFDDDDTIEEVSLDAALDTPVIEETVEEIKMDDVLGPETEESVPTVDEIVDENQTNTTDDLLGNLDESIEITDESTENNNIEYDFSEEVIEEPAIENIEVTETEDDEDDLPEEISIPTSDEILVDSSESDFINSVTETTEDTFDSVEDIDSQETPEENISDDLFVTEPMEEMSNDFVEDEIIEEEKPLFEESPVEEVSTDEEAPIFEDEVIIEETETPVEEILDDAPLFDENVVEETPVSEEAPVEEAPLFGDEVVIDETPAEQVSVEENPIEDAASDFEVDVIEEDSLSSVDDILDSSVETEVPIEEVIEETPVDESPVVEDVNEDVISESNVEYLTPKASEDNEIKGDLKQEIKSVLLYMDQLLENLPEDKIVEFAKSEEFTTYQKLFKDLGLA